MAKKKNKTDPPMTGTQPPANRDDALKQLLDAFGDRVEESLVLLFLDEQGLETARQTLTDIYDNARSDEASAAFAAPGGQPGGNTWHAAARSATVSDSVSESVTGSVVSGTSAAAVADDGSVASLLQSAFPMLRASDIRRALQQAGDDAAKASDILLNLDHLEATGQRLKGIDAFFRPDDAEDDDSVGLGNYSADSARRRRRRKRNTAAAIAAAVAGDDPAAGRRASNLSLDHAILAPLVVDEAGVLRDPPVGAILPVHTKTASSHPPPDLARSEAAAHQARHASSTAFAAAGAAFRRGRSDPLFRQAAVMYAEHGHALAQQARHSESAAADARVDSQSILDAGADAVLDLHGVPVHDGVRIAVDRARRWWTGLNGEDRARAARTRPLQVVTGVGLHSARGYSRMYGEVGAALERDGWKVQPGLGYYYISGRK